MNIRDGGRGRNTAALQYSENVSSHLVGVCLACGHLISSLCDLTALWSDSTYDRSVPIQYTCNLYVRVPASTVA